MSVNINTFKEAICDIILVNSLFACWIVLAIKDNHYIEIKYFDKKVFSLSLVKPFSFITLLSTGIVIKK